MSGNDDMRRYYAKRAPYYDDVYLQPERREDIAFLERYLAQKLAKRDVLEVACGTGFWTQFFAPHARRVVATDVIAEPLQQAGQRPGLEQVRLAIADAYALPAALGLFDAAFAALWFSHVPVSQRSRFLASLHARLLTGARVVFIDNTVAQLRDLPLSDKDAEGNTYQRRTLKDGSVHRVLKNFPCEHELRALVPFASGTARYLTLQNFWLFEYEYAAAAGDRDGLG